MSQLVPVGKHMGRATGGNLSEGNKAPYVAVTINIPGAGSLWWNGSLSETPFENPKGAAKCPADATIRDLLKMGWDGKDLAKLEGLGSVEIEVDVVHEQGNDNKTYAKPKYINKPGERGNSKPVEAGKIKGLNASLRGRVLDIQRSMGAVAAQSSAAPPVPANEEGDELPF